MVGLKQRVQVKSGRENTATVPFTDNWLNGIKKNYKLF
jgi:hypothetical protein